jgi:hypothetical protein
MATVRQQQLLTDKLEFVNTAVPEAFRQIYSS